jgi:hypothetical protein
MAKFNTLRFAIKTEVGLKYILQIPPTILRDCAIPSRKATGAPYFGMSATGVTKKSNTLATINMSTRNNKICLRVIQPPKRIYMVLYHHIPAMIFV